MKILNLPTFRQIYYYKRNDKVKQLSLSISAPYIENIGEKEMMKIDVFISCDCTEYSIYELGTNIFELWLGLLIQIDHYLKNWLHNTHEIHHLYDNELFAINDDVSNAVDILKLTETHLDIMKQHYDDIPEN